VDLLDQGLERLRIDGRDEIASICWTTKFSIAETWLAGSDLPSWMVSAMPSSSARACMPSVRR
jgi:hypothetical protein